MPDLDVDRARKVGVSVPPVSKADYLEASQQLQPGFVATVDGTDPSLGWTSQHLDPERDGGAVSFVDPGDTLPGQVYLPSQLPDPQAAIQAGLTPVKVPEHLITENENHIQGPEPSEIVAMEYRNKLRQAVVDYRSDGDDVPDTAKNATPVAAGSSNVISDAATKAGF